MIPSWRPFAGALLVGLLCSMPAFADTSARRSSTSPIATETVLSLESWEYTAGSMSSGTSNNRLITDIVVFVVWTNLNIGNNNVSAMIYDLLLLEYVYDLSVLGTISQAQLDALVFGEFFINTHLIIPAHSTTASTASTSSGAGSSGNRPIISRIRAAIRSRLGR